LRFDRFGDLDGLTQHLWQQPLGQPSIMRLDAYRDGDRFVVLLDLHGVLTVTIPVADEAKPRKIEISSGGETKAIEAAAA